MNTEANVWVRINLVMLIWLILMMKTSKAMMMYMEKFSKLPNLHCKKRNASSQEIIKWSQPRMVCEWLHVEKMHLLLRKTRQLVFCASKTEKDRQHKVRLTQLLMTLKSLYAFSVYAFSIHSSNMQQFSIWRVMNNMDQPKSVMSPNHSSQLNTVV